MNAILLYVVQSAICLSLFYGLYLLLLRREAFFRFNRIVLLSIMVLSMAIPLMRIPAFAPTLMPLPALQLKEAIENVATPSNYSATSNLKPETLNLKPETLNLKPETSNLKPQTLTPNLMPSVYLAGFLVTLALALVSLLSVARIIVTARPVEYRRQRLLISSKKINSFTFSRWIVLSEMDYERFSEEIVAHEIIHLRNGHFWDLCMVNAIVILQWFNPLAWLLRRELKALHEYEADRSTLTQGINATRYQLLLIEKAAGASRYSVASCFAQSKIKKRIVMMNKQNPNPRARWKALLFIPLAALLMQCFSRPDINREPENHEHIILPQQFKPSIAGATSEMIPDRAASSDLFFPHGFKNPRKYQFAIFNKTGQKVFDTTDPKQGWNGYFEGALCEEGVYRYRIEGEFENGQPFLKTGDVTLLITTPMTQEDIWEKIREEFLSNLDRQITINGKTMKFRNIDSELPEEYKTYQLIFSTTHNARLGVVNEQTAQVRWPLSNFILNGQWITDEDADVNIKKIVSVKTYTAAEAENLFGVKTENGTIAIVTQ